MSKVEVSAIITGDGWFDAMAITPCATKVFIFIRRHNRWVESVSGFALWQDRIEINNKGKRVYRGIFTIEVPYEK